VKHVKTRAATLAALLALSVTGCASSQSRSPDPTLALTTLSAAEEAGAADVPRAALHLKLAREQMKVAALLIEHSQNDEAYLVHLRAEADAKLALELARRETLRRASEEELLRLRSLQRSTVK
jgi:hypothetical protein